MAVKQELIVRDDLQEITLSSKNMFLEQQDKLKEFSRKIPSDVKLPSAENRSLFSCFGRDRVTSADVNNLAESIQTAMIAQNKHIKDIIREFETVYNTFSSLDKVYLSEIVRSFNTAVKAHEKANQNIQTLDKQQKEIQENQQDIKNIISNQKIMIDVLKNFKEKLEKLRHLCDVDSIFANVEENQKHITVVSNKLQGNIENLSQEMKAEMLNIAQKHNNAISGLKSEISANVIKAQEMYDSLAGIIDDVSSNFQNKIEYLSQDVNSKIVQAEQRYNKSFEELKSNIEENAQKSDVQCKSFFSTISESTEMLKSNIEQSMTDFDVKCNAIMDGFVKIRNENIALSNRVFILTLASCGSVVSSVILATMIVLHFMDILK